MCVYNERHILCAHKMKYYYDLKKHAVDGRVDKKRNKKREEKKKRKKKEKKKKKKKKKISLLKTQKKKRKKKKKGKKRKKKKKKKSQTSLFFKRSLQQLYSRSLVNLVMCLNLILFQFYFFLNLIRSRIVILINCQ